MPAQLIDGTQIARTIRAELQTRVAELQARRGIVPGLAVLQVGDDPASRSYVIGKRRACEELGLRVEDRHLPEAITEAELLAVITELNRDPLIHGILVQLPLPPHLDEARVLLALDPDRDVDGFHPINAGRLLRGLPGFVPCTPLGVQQLLLRTGIPLSGAEVVIVGRSNLVGRPLANLLGQKQPGANATVTLCHSATRDLPSHCLRAEVLIVAAGVPRLVGADWVREGAAVIDVGVHRIGQTADGKARLVGDVDFEAVRHKAGWLTPVPGGVGPLTITMLLANTIWAAEHGPVR